MADGLLGNILGSGDPSALYEGLLSDEGTRRALGMRQLMAAAGAFGQAAMPSRMPIPIGAALGNAAAAMGTAGDDVIKARTQALQGQLYGAQAQQMKAKIDLYNRLMGGGDIGLLNDAQNPVQPAATAGTGTGTGAGGGSAPLIGDGTGGGSNWEIEHNNFAGMRNPNVPAAGGPKTNPSGWQTFDTPAAGVQAIGNQLDRYYAGKTTGQPLTTLRQMVSTWAPPSENDTGALVARASAVTGLAPDAPVDMSNPAVRAKVTEAFIRNEQGGNLHPKAAEGLSAVYGNAWTPYSSKGGVQTAAAGAVPQPPGPGQPTNINEPMPPPAAALPDLGPPRTLGTPAALPGLLGQPQMPPATPQGPAGAPGPAGPPGPVTPPPGVTPGQPYATGTIPPPAPRPGPPGPPPVAPPGAPPAAPSLVPPPTGPAPPAGGLLGPNAGLPRPNIPPLQMPPQGAPAPPTLPAAPTPQMPPRPPMPMPQMGPPGAPAPAPAIPGPAGQVPGAPTPQQVQQAQRYATAAALLGEQVPGFINSVAGYPIARATELAKPYDQRAGGAHVIPGVGVTQNPGAPYEKVGPDGQPHRYIMYPSLTGGAPQEIDLGQSGFAPGTTKAQQTAAELGVGVGIPGEPIRAGIIPPERGGVDPGQPIPSPANAGRSYQTTIPAITQQARTPDLKTYAQAQPEWIKETGELSDAGVLAQRAESNLNLITKAFQTIQSGTWAQQTAEVKGMWQAVAQTLGIAPPQSVADLAAVQTALHANYKQTLAMLAASNKRFTGNEFKINSEAGESVGNQPEANLNLLAADLGQVRQIQALAQDWNHAQTMVATDGSRWVNPDSFKTAWTRANPTEDFIKGARDEIGQLKGTLPAGAVPTGRTYQGKPVYTVPDGQGGTRQWTP